MFCHMIPRETISAYVKTRLPQRIRFLQVTVPPEGSHLVDEKARLKYMDKFGIDVEVLAFSQVGELWQTLSEGEKLRFTKIVNDSMAAVANRNPGRLVASAVLPVLGGEAVDELVRAIEELGLKGCMIYSNVGGKPLDSPEFLPFFQKMAKYDLPIFIHPTNWKYYDWVFDYQLLQIFGWPFDTSLAMGRLVFGGIMEKFPNLKVIAHHLGGMIPSQGERIAGFYEEAKENPELLAHYFPNSRSLKKSPLEYFKRFYGDTAVEGSVSALRCGCEFFGTDRVVFATDYPFGPQNGESYTRAALECIRKSGLSKEDQEKILEKNARRLLRIK